MSRFQLNQKNGVNVQFVTENQEDNTLFSFAKEHSSFSGKKGEVYIVVGPNTTMEYLVGLGKVEKLNPEVLRLVFYKLAKQAKENKVDALQCTLPKGDEFCSKAALRAAVEGILQADYSFSRKMKKEDSEEKEEKVCQVSFLSEELEEDVFSSIVDEVQELINGVFFARDLVNETSNNMYPEVLAEKAEEKLSAVGVDVKIFNKEQIEEIGMHAFLAVAQGSDREPRLIIMHYNGDPDSDEKTALVGKGLTYDSGGYCLKTPGGMLTMHADMGGAGTVMGTMYALAKNKVKTNVVGVVAACENLVSGHAFKTGDIIGSLSGKTIEVLNTDAEGRLTLADAIHYATGELAADRVIDLATLTGAAVVALSDEYTAALTNDREFYREFEMAAKKMGEKVWLMPNDEDLAERNRDTKVADVLNSPGRGAGSITAGQFVGEFLAKDVPWIHLDIAGTAYFGSGRLYYADRATGYHVKSLYQLLKPKCCK